MKKILGILGLLIFICLATWIMADLSVSGWSPEDWRFIEPGNIQNIVRRTALFGIISIGAAFVIITSGIDLSIGSVICLIGCLTPHLLVDYRLTVASVLLIICAISLLVGLLHGLLVTKLKLQPFIVTLCGLLIYRGATRGFVRDQTQGFKGGFEQLRAFQQGEIAIPGTEFGIPNSCLILLVVALLSAFFLNYTVYGRYLFALGRNENAAKYSGINTDRMTILAYVICGFLSGLGGLLFVLDVGSAQPVDFGNFYELYAIAAAVLGGCSLRGGEGAIIGVVIGTAVIQVLRNSINLIDAIPTNIEFAVIGVVIIGGVITDELVKRMNAKRLAANRLKNADRKNTA